MPVGGKVLRQNVGNTRRVVMETLNDNYYTCMTQHELASETKKERKGV